MAHVIIMCLGESNVTRTCFDDESTRRSESRMRYSTAPAPASQMLVAQFAANHDVIPLRGVTGLEMKLVVLFLPSSSENNRITVTVGRSYLSRALCMPKLAL